MINITINGNVFEIKHNLDAEQEADILETKFDSNEEAVVALSGLIPDIGVQLNNNNNNKEVKMVKTKAVYLEVTSTCGWWVSREFLIGTGYQADAKMVKDEPYKLPYVEFISRCSKQMRGECQSYLEKLLDGKMAAIKVVPTQQQQQQQQQQGVEAIIKPKGTKAQAVKYMLGLLQDPKAKVLEGKGLWLADFIQGQVKVVTQENINMVFKNSTLLVSFQREYYMANKVMCQKAIETFKVACRGTNLEYGALTNGQLPVRVRGTWTTHSI